MSEQALGHRALLALYRNHPDTQLPERYTWRASAAAREHREMLLAWAATQSDERLLWCRNLGPAALAWIRSAGGDLSAPRHGVIEYDDQDEWLTETDEAGATQIVARDVPRWFGRLVVDTLGTPAMHSSVWRR